jgi:Secretion system C-terminal sorting domain
MWFANFNLKRLLFTAASFIFSLSAFICQSGFNLRMPIEGATVFQSVHCTSDTTYIIASWSMDTINNNHLNFELLEFDQYGTVINTNSFYTPECIVGITEESDSQLASFYMQLEQTVMADKYTYQLFYFNKNLDTLYTSQVQSPYVDSTWTDSDFMQYEFSIIASDSSAYISYGIYHPTSINDVCIKKLSPTGEELWTYIYATYAEVDACYALLPQVDGGVIAGIMEGQSDTNPYAYTRFTKLNALSEEEWIIDSRDLFYGTYKSDCLIQDGNTLITTGSFHDLSNTLRGISKIAKFDLDGNLIWQRDYGEYSDYNLNWEVLKNIVQSCDSNYVAGGSWFSIPGSEEIIEGQNNPDYDQFANIVKLDRETGDVIWERKYRFLEIYRDKHTLVDMKATLDGGVIFCGEARDSYNILAPPLQQGWLVKLDECGCLVPGCDTLCSYVGCGVADTSFFPSIGSHFIVGPNPASQFINIYVGTLESLKLESLNFQLFDIQGKLVYEFLPTQTETTYMLSTDKFAGGLYVLSLSDGERVLQQEKIVVER